MTSVRGRRRGRLPGLIDRFEDLQARDGSVRRRSTPTWSARVGALPTEYVYYYYDPRRYVDGVASNGSSRGQDVAGLNSELMAAIKHAFAGDDVHAAWTAYSNLLGVRRDTYMRTDTDGDSGQAAARAAREARGAVPMQAEKSADTRAWRCG